MFNIYFALRQSMQTLSFPLKLNDDVFLYILAWNIEFARYTSAFACCKHQVPAFDFIAKKACLIFEKTFLTYILFASNLWPRSSSGK